MTIINALISSAYYYLIFFCIHEYPMLGFFYRSVRLLVKGQTFATTRGEHARQYGAHRKVGTQNQEFKSRRRDMTVWLPSWKENRFTRLFYSNHQLLSFPRHSRMRNKLSSPKFLTLALMRGALFGKSLMFFSESVGDLDSRFRGNDKTNILVSQAVRFLRTAFSFLVPQMAFEIVTTETLRSAMQFGGGCCLRVSRFFTVPVLTFIEMTR